jgi:crotonobetainyl-CoA:carnitine CoA-transferase CaiB-like acyl-CoA transferase
MLLGDMGATVIKIEGPQGDDTRSWKPPVRGDEATYFLSVNRNKRSVMLDLNEPEDLRVAHQIVGRSDVLVENFKTGSLKKFGLDYDALSAERSDLVYASITGFGEAGGSRLLGYDIAVQAMSGMMSLTGESDGPAMRMGVSLIDVLTGMHAITGVLAALHHRSQTGEGQRLQVNLLSSALSGMVNQATAFVAAGTVPRRLGNDHPSLFPYGPFPTRDGELVLAIGNDHQFGLLCSLIELEPLARDERFNTPEGRSRHREILRPIIIKQLSSRSAAEWFPLLNDAGIPSGPVLDVEQGIRFAEELGLDPVVVSEGGNRSIPTIRNPINFSLTPATYGSAPPLLGADNEAVREWLQRP